MSGLILAGDVYIDRLSDTGESTGLVGPINVTQLSLQTPTEKVQRTSKRKDSYGQTLDTVNLQQPTTIEMVIDDQPAELLAMAMLGDVEQINQGAGSVTLTDITLPADNKWAKLPHANLSETGLELFESDGTTPIAAAAFEVNYALGMIRTLPGGARIRAPPWRPRSATSIWPAPGPGSRPAPVPRSACRSSWMAPTWPTDCPASWRCPRHRWHRAKRWTCSAANTSALPWRGM